MKDTFKNNSSPTNHQNYDKQINDKTVEDYTQYCKIHKTQKPFKPTKNSKHWS